MNFEPSTLTPLINHLQTAQYLHNSLWNYLLAVGIFIATVVLFKVIEIIVLSRLAKIAKHTTTNLDDIFIKVLGELGRNFYVIIGFYLGATFLNLSSWLNATIYALFLATLTYEAVHLTVLVINFLLEIYSAKREKDSKPNQSFIHLGMLFIRIILFSVGGLFVLSNLGIDITALAASLGIGSLAIALALQNILGDMFSSFSIYVDKPFEVGDFIVVGDNLGTVSKIGLKTTRITTLHGEELVISNNEMVSARVHNYRRMEKRRAVITFRVKYSTPNDLAKQIPDMVKDIVGKIELLELDRCHLSELSDSALIYELCYYVKSKTYTDSMNAKQEFNFALLTCFEKHGIEFAFPAQTIFVKDK